MDPSTFGFLPKGGHQQQHGDWATAFESTASSSSAQAAGFRRPTDPRAVAETLATSQDTYHAFATDGSAVMDLLHSHMGPIDDLLDAAWDHPQHQPSFVPAIPDPSGLGRHLPPGSVDDGVQEGWSVLSLPATSAHAREHWNHWTMQFAAAMADDPAAAMTNFGLRLPPPPMPPPPLMSATAGPSVTAMAASDGAEVVTYAREAYPGQYADDIWSQDAVDAWSSALDRWEHGRQPAGRSSSANAIDPAALASQSPQATTVAVTSVNPAETDRRQSLAVNRLKMVLAHLRPAAEDASAILQWQEKGKRD
ncbi:hypothetical protein BC828DRAFT_390135 [Blastocladiella britannica]|nr:hypothetical protein BC828DRAFT_390135 [Blastocladiella britannica]